MQNRLRANGEQSRNVSFQMTFDNLLFQLKVITFVKCSRCRIVFYIIRDTV